ncbi:MAG: oxygen-independent coproporphyrinogen III oxidase [Hyphomonadaceae bacterium]
MESRFLAYAERPAPRYTSYPTAPHFSPRVNGDTVRGWLGDLAPETALSLYLHVPYCRQLCWYCGCNTYAARREAPVADFVDTLEREIALIAAQLNARGVSEIHWGGGTPNILAPEQFQRISERIALHFDTTALVHHAIEIDPRFLDAEKVRAYAAAGVNRASLGVQDLNARVQEAIGRVQPEDVVRRAVDLLRDGGVGEINVDLMYGLPHQSEDDLRQSVEIAAAMAPQRIALFGYAHVPWFKKRQRLIPEDALPGAAARFDQAEAARTALEALGYVAIGLDHFALPRDELARAAREGGLRRSFQGYVVHEAEAIIGMGPSAISTLPQGYAQNISEPGGWAAAIAADTLAVARGHALTPEDRIRRRLIEQIMCDFEGDLAPLGGAAACAPELSTLAPLIADGLVRVEGDRVVLAQAARPFCRLVGLAFDAYAQQAAARYSRAV